MIIKSPWCFSYRQVSWIPLGDEFRLLVSLRNQSPTEDEVLLLALSLVSWPAKDLKDLIIHHPG